MKVDTSKYIPQHIAIIMDGNGRWAKQLGKARLFGHNNAIEAVRNAVEGCAELGVKYLTLYAFSTENWSRPQLEIEGLMTLLQKTIQSETQSLIKNNIKLQAIGEINRLPEVNQIAFQQAIDATVHCTGMILTLALSYSSKMELTKAIKAIAEKIKNNTLQPDEITEKIITQHLLTAHMPDPELMIRTSGEHRISNFMLWQLAYAELYFLEILWPDFRKIHLHQAIADFQIRERRFGKISEQLVS